MKNIAVQKGLGTISSFLTDQGYQVQEIDTTQKNTAGSLHAYDAVVLTGLDTNVLGIETTNTKIPIIDASGMTPEQVKKTIDKRS